MLFNPTVDLVLVSAIFVVISQTLQLVFMDRKQMRETQKEMKEKNKEYKALAAQGANADKKEMERVQKEMMELTGRSFKKMPKMMIASAIVFLPLWGLLNGVYAGTEIKLFFPLTIFWQSTGWVYWYFLCSLLISMTVTRVLGAYDNHLEKKRNNASMETQPTP